MKKLLHKESNQLSYPQLGESQKQSKQQKQ